MVIFIIALLVLIFFSIYMLIEFFEYLKKFHTLKWKEISFERPFGIAQENFYFYPIRPLKFIPFMIAKGDIIDKKVTVYKITLNLSLLAIAFLLLICSFI
jgi:hypothetical protein